MKRIQGKILAHQFKRQGVEINPQLETYLHGEPSTRTGIWAPTNVLQTIVEAARLTYTEPHLAKRPITKTPRIRGDTPSSVLVDIINDSISRWNRPEGFVMHDHTPERPDSCSHAEMYFNEALYELEIISAIPNPNMVKEIFVDANGPVILRKKRDIKTGLALRQITINGIGYPAGSIVAVKAKEQLGQKRPKIIREVTELERLTFLRLSAFALDHSERFKSFHLDSGDRRDEGLEAALGLTMENIVESVRQGVEKIKLTRDS